MALKGPQELTELPVYKVQQVLMEQRDLQETTGHLVQRGHRDQPEMMERRVQQDCKELPEMMGYRVQPDPKEQPATRAQLE